MDIENLSDEEKNALIKELLLERLEKKKTEPEVKKLGGTSQQPKKIDKITQSSVNNGRTVVPINQREHYNKFDEMAGSFKVENNAKLLKEDKENWKGRQPTERRPPPDIYEVNCKRCSKQFQVYESHLRHDPDEGTYYICNKCSGRGGN